MAEEDQATEATLAALTDSMAAEAAANMLVELTEATVEEAAAPPQPTPPPPAVDPALVAEAKVGTSFDSFEEVEAFVHAYEEAHFVKYYKYDSRTVAGARKRMPSRRMEDRLRYHSVTFCCVHHGKFKSTSQGLRPRQTTLRSGCPSKMRFTISRDGKQLNLVEIVVEHTHPRDKDSFRALPQKRRLSSKERLEAYDILEKRGKKSAQRHLQDMGKEVKMRDLHNLLASSRRQAAIYTNIRAILDHLSETEDQSSVVEVVTKADSKIVGIFYQDREMARVYAAYPQHLVLDATCKGNHLRMPLYAVLVEDGNGDCEVVALFLVLASNLDSLQSMLRRFKANNPAWPQARVILADKEFPERGLLEEEFPQASVQVCLYHALRAFRLELSGERMGLGKKEAAHCLRLMRRLATSRTEAEYAAHYQQLLNSQLEKVVEYYNATWHFLLEEWVEGLKPRSIALKAAAAQQLESVDTYLREALRDDPPAAALMANLKKAAASLRHLRDQSAAGILSRELPASCGPGALAGPRRQFESYVTPFALKHVERQLKLGWQVSIAPGATDGQSALGIKTSKGLLEVDPTSCTCVFFKSLGLPCRHVFAVRRYRGLPLFAKDTVSRRWTLDYYKSVSRVAAQEEPAAAAAADGESSTCSLFSRQERHVKASVLAKELANAVADAPAGRFGAHMAVLRDLLSVVQKGASAEVTEAEAPADDAGGQGGETEEPAPAPAPQEIRIKVTSITLPSVANKARKEPRPSRRGRRKAGRGRPKAARGAAAAGASDSVNGQRMPPREGSDAREEGARDSSAEEMDQSASQDASEKPEQADDIPDGDEMDKEEVG